MLIGSDTAANLYGYTYTQFRNDINVQILSVDNCEDLEKVKNTVGTRMSISGNVPPVNVLRYGSIDEVIESVKLCLEKACDNPMGLTYRMC